MPIYEYACPDCGGAFEIRATMSEKRKGLEPACPKCGGRNAVQVFGSLTILAGGRSRSSPCGPGACASQACEGGG